MGLMGRWDRKWNRLNKRIPKTSAKGGKLENKGKPASYGGEAITVSIDSSFIALYCLNMTVSTLDVEELKKYLSSDQAKTGEPLPNCLKETETPKPVSLQDLFDRAKELFTPEEAEALARRIEEGREQLDD